jgi:hypothetical protein
MEPPSNQQNNNKQIKPFYSGINIIQIIVLTIGLLAHINVITSKYDYDIFVNFKNLLNVNFPIDQILSFSATSASVIVMVLSLYNILVVYGQFLLAHYMHNLFTAN